MSNTAQITANTLHDLGLSDSEIAEACNVRREYINRIRNGSKNASKALESTLLTILVDIKEDAKELRKRRTVQPHA